MERSFAPRPSGASRLKDGAERMIARQGAAAVEHIDALDPRTTQLDLVGNGPAARLLRRELRAEALRHGPALDQGGIVFVSRFVLPAFAGEAFLFVLLGLLRTLTALFPLLPQPVTGRHTEQ